MMRLVVVRVILAIYLGLCGVSCHNPNYDLGDGYAYVSDNQMRRIISGPDEVSADGVIPCTVVAFAFDNLFIIAKQKADPNCRGVNIVSAPEQYWIINKRMRRIYGPLNLHSFANERDILDVPRALNLNQ